MTYIVKDVIKITKNSCIVAVEDVMQNIKIGMYLDGFAIRSLKRHNEDDLVDLYIKENKKHIEYKVDDSVEITEKEVNEPQKEE